MLFYKLYEALRYIQFASKAQFYVKIFKQNIYFVYHGWKSNYVHMK